MPSDAVLHVVFDQMSIWSIDELLEEIERLAGLTCELHCIASTPGPGRVHQDAEAYLEQVKSRTSASHERIRRSSSISAVFEAPPLIAAVLAAQTLDASKGLAMLRAVQAGLDTRGLHVADPAELCEIAAEVDFDPVEFATAYANFDLDEHIEATRQLLARCTVTGREALILELGERHVVVPHRRFVGDSAEFRDWLRVMLDAGSKADH